MNDIIAAAFIWAFFGQAILICRLDGRSTTASEFLVELAMCTGPIGLCILFCFSCVVYTFRFISGLFRKAMGAV